MKYRISIVLFCLSLTSVYASQKKIPLKKLEGRSRGDEKLLIKLNRQRHKGNWKRNRQSCQREKTNTISHDQEDTDVIFLSEFGATTCATEEEVPEKYLLLVKNYWDQRRQQWQTMYEEETELYKAELLNETKYIADLSKQYGQDKDISESENDDYWQSWVDLQCAGHSVETESIEEQNKKYTNYVNALEEEQETALHRLIEDHKHYEPKDHKMLIEGMVHSPRSLMIPQIPISLMNNSESIEEDVFED